MKDILWRRVEFDQRYSETSVGLYQTARRHIPQDNIYFLLLCYVSRDCVRPVYTLALQMLLSIKPTPLQIHGGVRRMQVSCVRFLHGVISSVFPLLIVSKTDEYK